MKPTAVLIFITLTICHGINVPPQKEKIQLNENKHVDELPSDDFIINLLPLKILLEYKLKSEKETQSETNFQNKEKLQTGLNDGSMKLASVSPRNENLQSVFCSDINLLKNLSDPEILSIINNNENNKEDLLTKKQLQKIYDSIKDCFYVKAVNAKLWGPLWHCLNRLFLFFVFN